MTVELRHLRFLLDIEWNVKDESMFALRLRDDSEEGAVHMMEARVREHIHGCAPCSQAVMEAVQKLQGLLGDKPVN